MLFAVKFLGVVARLCSFCKPILKNKCPIIRFTCDEGLFVWPFYNKMCEPINKKHARAIVLTCFTYIISSIISRNA